MEVIKKEIKEEENIEDSSLFSYDTEIVVKEEIVEEVSYFPPYFFILSW